MNLLQSGVRELAGMFIDDGALAAIVLILITVIGLAVRAAYLDALTGALALMFGCLMVLAESLSRASRSAAKRRR